MLGWLNLYVVIVIAFLVGLGNLLFEISYKSLLPDIVPNDNLVLANTRLETGRTSAALTGPLVAGALLEFIAAPFVLLVQSVLHLFSATRIHSIQTAQSSRVVKKPFTLAEVREGIAHISRDRRLAGLAGAAATYNFGYGLLTPLLVLVLIVEYAIVLSESIAPIAALFFALATPSTAVVFFAIGNFSLHYGLAIYNITSVSLRQFLCPPNVLGRVTATMGFFASGTLPLGALLGGVIGEWFGARIGLIIVLAAFVVAVMWLVISPIPKMAPNAMDNILHEPGEFRRAYLHSARCRSRHDCARASCSET